MAARLRGLSDDALYTMLSEAVYLERRRFAAGDEPNPMEGEAIDALARALRGGRTQQEIAAVELVRHYADEIHNRFSPRTYGFATKVLPGALTWLLSARHPADLLGGDMDPQSRVLVHGPLDRLRQLAATHTLIFAPTHVSNLDSPLIGYALYAASLPPVVYGAGLNLFSNPVMSFFMSRLGAYTVDRRKKHAIYKEVLKDYSVEALSRRCHSLFFPGGTRSRSGRIERHIKKGLLGTGLQAWQEGLDAGRPNPDVLVVPCNLSCSLVLEAETLIEDSLAEEGRSRYIITDDEFAEPRVVASFLTRVLNLDASVYVRFGEPLDVLGNPVDADGRTLDPHGEPVDRRGYVLGHDGRVQWDAQRDRVYTEGLARALERCWMQGNTALATHLSAFCAWQLLRAEHPRLDAFQCALLAPAERRLRLDRLLASIDRVQQAIRAAAAQGRLHEALPATASGALDEALARFATFHTRRALERVGDEVTVDPKLALYYGNRLVGYGFEGLAAGRTADGGGA